MKATDTKICVDCQQTLPLDAFHTRKLRCKPCTRIRRKEFWPSDSKEGIKRYNLLKRYGITLEEAEYLYNQQNGKCQICDVEMPSIIGYMKAGSACIVDHNALTGEVRGLLCNNCNIFIGHAKEDVGRLHKAIVYLAERGTYHPTNKDSDNEEAHKDAEESRQSHGRVRRR